MVAISWLATPGLLDRLDLGPYTTPPDFRKNLFPDGTLREGPFPGGAALLGLRLLFQIAAPPPTMESPKRSLTSILSMIATGVAFVYI